MLSFSTARAAFALAALLMSGAVAVAQDAPRPQIAALLPRARESNGLQLRITDAGFAVVGGLGSFYFSPEITAPKRDLSAQQLDDAVHLISLFAPDGTPLRLTDVRGQRKYSSEVSPLLKSVRAEFEVRDLALPAVAATGRETTHYEPENIALPAMPTAPDQITTSAPDAIKFVTPRGTRLELVKLTREKQGERSEVAALWKWTAPQNTPGMSAEIESMNVAYFGVQNGSVRALGENYVFPEQRVKEGEIEFQINNVPTNAQAINLAFDFTESARQWRQAAATQRVSFEMPVAALWEIAPLAPQIPDVAVAKARNADFEARWEMRQTAYDGGAQARLWLRDLAPAPDGSLWTIQGATLPQLDGQERNLLVSTQGWGSVFHTDNSLAGAGESSVAFPLYRPETLPESADLTVTAQRARTLLSAHVLPLVPIPKRNESIEFGPQEVFDGVWHLRRIAWVDDEKLKDNWYYSDGAGLILTFDLAPGAYLAEDSMELQNEIFTDEKGVLGNSSSAFIDGDISETGREKDRVTLILSPPDASSSKFGGNFQVFQRTWSGPKQTLVVPAVPLVSPVKNAREEN